MIITLNWQTIITAGAVVSALVVLGTWLFKLVRWVDKQKQQDEKIEALGEHHDHDIALIQDELQLHTWGVLACLKGLQELGCNGPVTEAIQRIEKELNKKAHHKEGH